MNNWRADLQKWFTPKSRQLWIIKRNFIIIFLHHQVQVLLLPLYRFNHVRRVSTTLSLSQHVCLVFVFQTFSAFNPEHLSSEHPLLVKWAATIQGQPDTDARAVPLPPQWTDENKSGNHWGLLRLFTCKDQTSFSSWDVKCQEVRTREMCLSKGKLLVWVERGGLRGR